MVPCHTLDKHASRIHLDPSSAGPPVVALGGTFDHLHAAHKLLLHLALFLSSRKLIVGVMADRLLASKSNASFVQSLKDRVTVIEQFLLRRGAYKLDGSSPTMQQKGAVQMDVVEIFDGYGPTAWDDDIQALVVSQETLGGGKAVNKLRGEKELPLLDIFVIDVIASRLEVPESEEGGAVVPVEEESDEEEERRGKIHVRIGHEVRTLDLSGEKDEQRLKELKMGSTAIRQWIADRRKESD